MTSHLVIDGNAFYEIDDECMKKKKELLKKQEKQEQREKIDRQDLLIQKKKLKNDMDERFR